MIFFIQDAVRVLSNILVYIVRTQHIHARLTTGYDNLAKRREQVTERMDPEGVIVVVYVAHLGAD